MLAKNYLHVMWDDYADRWRCWVFRNGQVTEREYLADIVAVVARAQELQLPVDMGGGQGRLRAALRAAGVRLLS
ncbi:MAG: hypothetical protein H7Y32_13530, partial [Chloroflexales bacterium]|nr:hypothetical protein [Chloroflexales bacterium]